MCQVLCICMYKVYVKYIYTYTFTYIYNYLFIRTYYLFQMLTKSDIIKISFCGVGPVLGSAQNMHLISSLPEMMMLHLALTICILESMTNYGFKEKVKKTTKKKNLCKLDFHS